jgi:hypothetical protein
MTADFWIIAGLVVVGYIAIFAWGMQYEKKCEESRAYIRGLVRNLPAPQLFMLTLMLEKDLTHAQIAELTGTPIEQVRSELSSATTSLKNTMHDNPVRMPLLLQLDVWRHAYLAFGQRENSWIGLVASLQEHNTRSSSWLPHMSRRLRICWRGRGKAPILVCAGTALAALNLMAWRSLTSRLHDWPVVYVFAARVLLPLVLLVCTSWFAVAAWRASHRSDRLGDRVRGIGYGILSGLPPLFLTALLANSMLVWRAILSELEVLGWLLKVLG